MTIAAADGVGNHNLLSTTHPDTVAASPVLGDLIAANASPAWARLAGQTTTTRKFLRQVGTGSASALPAWDTLLAGDLPTHNHAAGDIYTGTLTLARDGTAADLSAPGFAAVTVAVLASGDLPTHTTPPFRSATRPRTQPPARLSCARLLAARTSATSPPTICGRISIPICNRSSAALTRLSAAPSRTWRSTLRGLQRRDLGQERRLLLG